LAEHGRIKLSRHQIAKIRGQLFLTKNDIILNYDLLKPVVKNELIDNIIM